MPVFWDGLCHALPSQQVHLDCFTVCVVIVTLTDCTVTISCDTVRPAQLLQQVCLCCSAQLSTKVIMHNISYILQLACSQPVILLWR